MKRNIIYYTIVDKDNNMFNKDDNETNKALVVLEKLLNKLNLRMDKIFYSEYGKPYFKNDIKFNYSHSKNYILCAISLDEVGVDIEEDREISDDLALRFLNNIEEKDRLKAWVIKEAYSKLVGTGLAIGFNKIDINKIKENKLFNVKNKYTYCIFTNSKNVEYKYIDIEG